ncbi:MAG: hypothetical protein ACLTKI_06925 [Lachnospiraceae bacterium]
MNVKRIFAIISLVLIAALYLIALICAFIGSPLARSILMSALFATIVLPCVAYGLQVWFKHRDQ